MKIFDERIQVAEITDLSNELIENLSQALVEDYGFSLNIDGHEHLKKELIKVLAKFFSIKV
jgi:septum formation topological specificity factor MinE